jgi:hypothetical protein
MKSIKSILLLFIIVLLIPACLDEKVPNIDGAWKTKDLNSLSQKPFTIVFDREKLITAKESVSIEFKKKDDVILVYRAGDTTSPIYTILVKDKDVLQIAGFINGTHDYYRTTIEDVLNIRHTKVSRPVPKDPF